MIKTSGGGRKVPGAAGAADKPARSFAPTRQGGIVVRGRLAGGRGAGALVAAIAAAIAGVTALASRLAFVLPGAVALALTWPAATAFPQTPTATAPASRAAPGPARIGSKRFTESYILGEILAQTIRRGGGAAEHRQGLGNTAIVLGALESGAIDVYPEYTGTIAREVFQLDHDPTLAELNGLLAPRGLKASIPLGFNNSYAIGVRDVDAQRLGLNRIGDLAQHPDLRLAMTQEFLGRQDGWPGLKTAYQLPFATPRGMDHGLAFQAIAEGRVDAIDVYTTDAKIDRYAIRVLDDNRHFFPAYDAVLLHRIDFETRLPQAWAALQPLAASIDDATMRRLNAAAELDHQSFDTVARRYLDGEFGAATTAATASFGQRFIERLFGEDFGRLTREHLVLVFGSVLVSIAVGVPLGVVAARRPRLASAVLATISVVQTIPSLALLAFLIPLTGQIGFIPAFIALVLYALLPIVRNTCAGLLEVPKGLSEAGAALDLSPRQVLRLIELPMARPVILAGVKTSAVINVGTATIAAFIGAGGYGERITTGLALNDHATLLAGAVPAAVLALLIEAGFNWLERRSSIPGRTTPQSA